MRVNQFDFSFPFLTLSLLCCSISRQRKPFHKGQGDFLLMTTAFNSLFFFISILYLRTFYILIQKKHIFTNNIFQTILTVPFLFILTFHNNPQLRHYPFTPKSPSSLRRYGLFPQLNNITKRLRVNRSSEKATKISHMPWGFVFFVCLLRSAKSRTQHWLPYRKPLALFFCTSADHAAIRSFGVWV